MVVALVLAAATVALYMPIRDAEFVDFDDYHYVVENNHVTTGLNLANVRWAFTVFSAGNWHPLTWLSHQLDCQLFGTHPAAHHLHSVLIHAANAALIVLVLHALTGSLLPSVLVAALFALHPLNVESVAWVSERKNVLSTLFWLLALWAWGAYVRRPSMSRYALVTLLFILGLMSKPMVVTLPCVLLLIDFWPLGRIRLGAPDARAKGVALVREKLPLFALVVVSSVVTVLAQKSAGAMTTLEQIPPAHRFANAAVSYTSYLEKTAWPENLSVFYPHPGRRVPTSHLALSSLFLVLVTTFVLRARARAPYLAVGWLWFVGTMVPVIGLVQVGAQAMADRYAYVPLLGIFIAVAFGLDALARERATRLLTAIPVVVALAALSVTTARQVGYWHDSRALFEHAKNVTRRNYVAFTNLGLALNKEKLWDQAIANFDQALKIFPRSAEAYGHRGLALARLGRTDDAIESLKKALEISPESVNAHNNLGVALRKRDPPRAVQELEKTIELDPDFTEARTNLGSVLLALGHREEAQRIFADALARDPRSAVTRFRIGSAFLEEGDLRQAMGHFETALELDPRHADAHNSRGVVLLRGGRLDEALEEFRRTLGLQAEHADALANAGVVALRQGRKEEAIAKLLHALRVNPRHADAHATLGAIFARDGRLDDAIPHFRAAVDVDPGNAVGRNNLGAALLQQGDLDGAIANLEAAVAANPQHVDALSNLGLALLKKGRLGEAVERLTAALRIEPNHAGAQAHLATIRAGRPPRTR